MRVDAGAQLDRRIHAEPPRRLELAAIIADVLDAGVGILGDVVAGREIGRVVPARRRDRHRQARRARGRPRRGRRRSITISWQGASSTTRGAIGLAIALDPGRADVFERLAEADAIDVAVGRQAGDQHGGVVAAALGVGRLREQERLALRLRDAAAILPAHQRVHLGVFVDRLVDDDQQAFARERQHMLMQVGIAARVQRRPVAIAVERGRRGVMGDARPLVGPSRAAQMIAQPCREWRTPPHPR